MCKKQVPKHCLTSVNFLIMLSSDSMSFLSCLVSFHQTMQEKDEGTELLELHTVAS